MASRQLVTPRLCEYDVGLFVFLSSVGFLTLHSNYMGYFGKIIRELGKLYRTPYWGPT